MKKIITILILILIVLISGCVEKECETSSECPDRECFTVQCAGYQCVYSPIDDCCGNEICELNESYSTCNSDCPNCDDKNECTVDEYDYYKKECVNTPIIDVICCGNGLCEIGETYENCTRDCPNCEDNNKCTKDSYDYHKQECVNEVITPCCGNEICDEGAETNTNCPADCPVCNDHDELTSDIFNYETQKCEYVVTHYFIDDFEEGIDENWAASDKGDWGAVTEGGNTFIRLGHVQANIQGEWNNYIFKFRYKWIEGNMHANFKQGNVGKIYNRYLIGISQKGVYNLGKQGGDDFQTLADIDVDLDEGWHTMEIRNYDNIINIYVDDELALKYKDTDNPLLSGKLGFEVHTGGSPVTPEFLIDDVEIKVISRDDVKAP